MFVGARWLTNLLGAVQQKRIPQRTVVLSLTVMGGAPPLRQILNTLCSECDMTERSSRNSCLVAIQMWRMPLLSSRLKVWPTCTHQGHEADHPNTGSAITIYGSTGPDHGLFSISLDGSRPLTLNGTAPVLRPDNLLVSIERPI
jgi:hypothetical protein